MYGFIALNVGIWGYALYTQEQARQGNIKPFVDFQKNFMLNLNWVVDEGRYWTMLTSTWSHLGLGHIAGNMISFYFLGDFVVRTPGIGPGRFLILIVGSGLMGSLMTIIQRKEAARATGGYDMKRGLGFSGSVMGVSAAAACLYPKSKVALYGIIPVPLWALVAGYFAYDGIFYNDPNSTIGHSGHIGGLIFGVVYYVTALRGVAFRF
jgi:membrane associated rhomboid family serine protease